MYRTTADFLADFQYASESTLKVLRACTDASLAREVAPGFRTLGFLAWHIVLSQCEMLSHAGVPATATQATDPQPATIAEIVAAYERSSQDVVEKVPSAWTDAALSDDVNMYGQTWKKGVVLSALIAHETHHRGQLTVLMRQAGLPVPGVFGPAKEEWAQMGIPAMP
jgi:uncharacterized damage-inducible protein DinB